MGRAKTPKLKYVPIETPKNIDDVFDFIFAKVVVPEKKT